MNQPGRIVTHGGGGGEAKKWLEALTENPPTPATWRRMLRAWVLFDNDAGDSDVRDLSRSAAALINLCEDVVSIHGGGLSWICLHRRRSSRTSPTLGSTLRRSRHAGVVAHVISWRADPAWTSWAWALDLKKGLRGDLRENLSQGDRKALKEGKIALEAHLLKAPFAGLSAGDIRILERGLADRLAMPSVRILTGHGPPISLRSTTAALPTKPPVSRSCNPSSIGCSDGTQDVRHPSASSSGDDSGRGAVW